MAGFFSGPELRIVKTPQIGVPRCGVCGLYKKCNSPKMEVSGEGRRRVLLVAEVPGNTEDEKGIQLCGRTGQHLEKVLDSIGIDMRKDCWLTNAVICASFDTKGKYRNPTDKEIEYCRPNLFNTINRLNPDVVILLGDVAVSSLIGGVWKEGSDKIGKWVGWQIPLHKPNMWICPTWYPSHIVRGNGDPVLDMFFKDHLEKAFSLKGKPWKTPPDYRSQVKVIIDIDEATENIEAIIKSKPKLAAFDYETTCLKPDSSKAQIYSCSISDGKTTIAYPWHGSTRLATQEFIRNKEIGKIASNLKFEQRWTMKEFGHGVRNWKWDTMLAAHTIDNRSGICSLKFQSFVLLGQQDYSGHISPYLESVKRGCNEENRIKEIGLHQELLYNGMDSLLEVEVAKVQMTKLGVI